MLERKLDHLTAKRPDNDRHPSTTPMGILRGLDYFGTVVFAATGSITAAR